MTEQELRIVDEYENMLDELNPVQVGHFRYDGSTVWVEPIRYHCGFLDYIDKDNPEEES